MKVAVDTGPFADAVGWAARGLADRPAAAVLGGMLVVDAAADGTATVSAFDYETSRQAAVACATHEPGRVLAGGRILAAVAAGAAGNDTRLTLDGSRLVVASGRMEARLPTLDASDYPKLPQLPAAAGTVASAALREAVARVAFAASKDMSMPVLTGVQLRMSAGGPLRLGATDRYRVAWADVPWDCRLGPGASVAVVVPARELADLAKTATGAVSVHAGKGASGEELFGLAWGGRHATTRLVDGKFPPYGTVLPSPGEVASTARVDRAGLLDAMDQVKPASGPNRALEIVVKGGYAQLTQSSKDGETVTTGLDCEQDGPGFTVHVNPAYLREALLAASGPVVHVRYTASDTAQLRPLLVEGDDPETYGHALMPIKQPA